MNRIIAFMLVAMTMLAAPAFGEEERPSADLSISALSQYIWRGYELSRDSIVIQPSATFSYKGFSANIWANFDTDLDESIKDQDSLNETDYTLTYDYSFGMVSGSIGWIYYALDQIDDSAELFVSASLDLPLSPTLTVYREVMHYPSTYITFDVSHSFALPKDMSLDISLLASALYSDDEDAYADPDDPDDEFSGLHHGEASIALVIPASSFMSSQDAQYFTITPSVTWVFPISGDGSNAMADASLDNHNNNFVYGGVTLSFSF